jgi:FixJ family two-component response regulator
MVYLLENDISLRRGLELFLCSVGIDVSWVENEETLLKDYKLHVSDMIIVDIGLPGLRASEILAKLSGSGVNLPIIVFTSSEEFNSFSNYKQYGVKACLRKPIDSEALLDTIRFNLVNN